MLVETVLAAALAFASANRIWVIEDGAERPLPIADASWPAYSPDGRRIAFTSLRRDGIFIANADGTGLRRVTRSLTIDVQPAWAPDGRRLAFARSVAGFREEIFTIGVTGRDLRRLTFNRGQDLEPDWAPSGKRIAWSFGATRAGARSGIYTMDPDGRLKRYRGAGIAPDWSPNGQRFAFVLGGDLFTSRVDGTQRSRLRSSATTEARPEWSPDGTEVAFLSTEGSAREQFRLWRLAPGGEPQPLSEREPVSSASWRPR